MDEVIELSLAALNKCKRCHKEEKVCNDLKEKELAQRNKRKKNKLGLKDIECEECETIGMCKIHIFHQEEFERNIQDDEEKKKKKDEEKKRKRDEEVAEKQKEQEVAIEKLKEGVEAARLQINQLKTIAESYSKKQKHFKFNQTVNLETTPPNQPTETCLCKNGSSAFSRKIAEVATNNQEKGIDNITSLFEEYKHKNAVADTFLENMPKFDAVSIEYIVGRLYKERQKLIS
ncbi:hypothetical protein ACTFIU_003407 [Dictyostelium citrinum]